MWQTSAPPRPVNAPKGALRGFARPHLHHSKGKCSDFYPIKPVFHCIIIKIITRFNNQTKM